MATYPLQQVGYRDPTLSSSPVGAEFLWALQGDSHSPPCTVWAGKLGGAEVFAHGTPPHSRCAGRSGMLCNPLGRGQLLRAQGHSDQALCLFYGLGPPCISLSTAGYGAQI